VRLGQACEPGFARHETFPLRWGWVRKAFAAAEENPYLFTAEDATVRLGVGKNMVRAIRFWGHATRAITSAPNPARPRMPGSAPTQLGVALYGNDGLDPYCEQPGSAWLQHWLLVAPGSKLPVWWALFHEFGAVEFTAEQANNFAIDAIGAVSEWNQPHPGSITKDVTCLLRSYATSPTPGARDTVDDLIDCPLRNLGLLRLVDPGTRTFRFVIGPKPTLPPEIAAYAAVDFLARADVGSRTVTLSRLTTEPGGPGRAFRLNDNDLAALLETAAANSDAISVTRPAGVTQLAIHLPPADAAAELLRAYYSRVTGHDQQLQVPVAGPAADALHGDLTLNLDDNNDGLDVLERLKLAQARKVSA
jgi:hypothetical protein